MIEYDSNNKQDFKAEFLKYFSFWKLFILSISICLIFALLYIKYSNQVYSVYSQILILNKEQSSMKLPSVEDLFSNSEINLENDMQIILSRPILSRVVDNLSLQQKFKSLGDIKDTELRNFPFKFSQVVPIDDIINFNSYDISFSELGINIINFKF